MADDKKNSPKDSAVNDPKIKRPYATLDLKATEIKVTPIAEKSSQSIAAEAARLAASAMAGKPQNKEEVPLPAPASTYAEAVSAAQSAATGASASIKSDAKADPKTQSQTAAQTPNKPASPSSATPEKSTAKSEAAASSSSAAGAAAAADMPRVAQRAATRPDSETVVIKKRGGFLSHLAAGLIGGVLVLSASEWALPQLGIDGTTSRLADNTAALERRLQSIEKNAPATLPDFSSIEGRLAAVETSAKQLPTLAEAQSHLVAETKAALAAAASDTGAPEYINRLAALEAQFKAMTDAGANNPNAGRMEQLAALTGKVSDLETSLQTQLTALRKNVSDDVEARIASTLQTSEAAKSGMQRIDKDVAGIKTDTVRLAERLESMKTDGDRTTEAVRLAREEQVAIKTAVDGLKTEAAKPADIAAAVAPVNDKIANLQTSLETVVKAEDDRKSSAERILLSIELQNLKRVIERGQKYAGELADVQKIAGGKVDLTALDKFKDTGVPTLADLTKDFRATAYKAIDADSEPAEGGVVDRLIAGAKSIVRVRKVSHDADDKSSEAIVGRMDMALNEGRLADVLATGNELSAKAKEAAQPFLDKVAAKAGVDTAVASLEAQLKSSLNPAAEAAPKATQ